MTNAEKFQELFKKFATEVWAFPEKDFLTWLNAEYKEPTTKNDLVPRNVVERIIKSPRTKEQMLLVLNSLPSQEPTTKNNLGVDCISREQALNEFCIYNSYDSIGVDKVRSYLKALPSVTPQEQQTFKWCTDCKEYDQEKHCCHRWSKVIRDTVEEIKQEQEPRKGHWLYRPHVYGVTYCSICDFELKIDNTNYCPNCGAKMKSEVEDGKID